MLFYHGRPLPQAAAAARRNRATLLVAEPNGYSCTVDLALFEQLLRETLEPPRRLSELGERHIELAPYCGTSPVMHR
jgi:hypothetical protein